ncbi:unnamed protein product, partial [Polarella glacialis]
VADAVELLKKPPAGEESWVKDLFVNRVPPGVDEAAYVKAGFLSAIVEGKATSALISKQDAIDILGTMQGGYNVASLVAALDKDDLAPKVSAAVALSKTLLIFDAFFDVEEKAKAGNKHAKQVIESWANAEWFTAKPKVAEKITVTVFKVTGETNTDDLSPAQDAWSRPDIPLHGLAMLKIERDGINNPIQQMEDLKKKGFPISYVGNLAPLIAKVGHKFRPVYASARSQWFMGEAPAALRPFCLQDIPNVPNKRTGSVCIGTKIAPIFFNTMEDAGALPIEADAADLAMGDVIDIYPYKGEIKRHGTDEIITTFQLKTEVLLDEVQAGGRIPLIIGRGLTGRARESLKLPPGDFFRMPHSETRKPKGWSLAQKMVGRACGVEGVLPGSYCEPKMTTVGSQDTTGPMTRDELKDLACLGFSADLVMQSFCHTAAYPKPIDVVTHHTLPDFIRDRGGVSLRPGDGIIHSWLNRMLLPDTVGTGGDSHTRFPIGISFPAGSGLVAFAAATGVMPLDMPESVLVRFSGQMQPGVTLRDLVHSIPHKAIEMGLLTVEKKGKKNVFSGRILEIEGFPLMKCEQAFELSDASAERSSAGCTIALGQEPIIEYLKSNVVMLKWMISEGYGDVRSMKRRIANMEAWLEKPTLLKADAEAEYHTTIEIDLNKITEPILCAPNDPDDARTLSSVTGQKIDEVFIGSCMTNIGHFRAAGKLLDTHDGQLPTKLWVAPPTKMDEAKLIEEGFYGIYGKVGARTELPGCSLCMGNQARVADNSTVVSTSTRNFPNRLGRGANVYLASAELAAVAAITGKLPTKDEYLQYSKIIAKDADKTYTYLNFNEVGAFSVL